MFSAHLNQFLVMIFFILFKLTLVLLLFGQNIDIVCALYSNGVISFFFAPFGWCTMHLVISIAFGCHTLVSPTNRKDLQFFVLSCFHTSLDRTLDILFVLSEFCKYGSRGLFTFLFHLLKTSLLFPFLIKQIEHYQQFPWRLSNVF